MLIWISSIVPNTLSNKSRISYRRRDSWSGNTRTPYEHVYAVSHSADSTHSTGTTVSVIGLVDLIDSIDLTDSVAARHSFYNSGIIQTPALPMMLVESRNHKRQSCLGFLFYISRKMDALLVESIQQPEEVAFIAHAGPFFRKLCIILEHLPDLLLD